MKVEYRLLTGSGLFLGIVGCIYWFWSREQTGTACLVFGFFAYALMGGYFLLQWRRRRGVPRAEDRDDATMEDGAGEIGFFPGASIWPPAMGVGAVFLAVGLVYGVWYLAIGGIFFVGALIGFVVEAEARSEGPAEPGPPVDLHPGTASTPWTSESVPASPHVPH